MLYRNLATQEDIDREYDPSMGRTDGKAVLQTYSDRSERFRQRAACRLDLLYGPTLAETLDFFPANDRQAPLHVFIHGGYWRSLSSKDFSYVAEGLVAQGVSVAVLNYALCPQVTLGEIVRQCRAAMAWVYRHADELAIAQDNITVSGHSAGGHLVGTLLATHWDAEYGLPADIIKGACAISGLFDLAPFPYSWLQPKLQLSGREVTQFSPFLMAPVSCCPLVALVGGGESDEFHRQSQHYIARLQQQQPERSLAYAGVPEADHFSIIDGLAESQGVVFETVLAQVNAGG